MGENVPSVAVAVSGGGRPGRPQRVRVAQFVDTTFYGGAEALMVEFAARLPALGYDVEVFHFDNPRFVSECVKRNITVVDVPGAHAYKSVRTLPKFCVQFARLLRRRRISLLHSHLLGSVTAGAFTSRLACIPHVGTLHDLYTIDDEPRYIHMLQTAAFLGTRLVTVAHTMERFYRSLGWFPRTRLTTIHNGIDGASASGVRSSVRTTLGLPETAVVFASVGRLVAIKRHAMMVDALAAVPATLDARLLIVGEGGETASLHRKVAQLGLSDRVVFLGFREDVHTILAASDAFLSTSSSEGLSCSIIEAMSAGLPSIVTDVGGNRELVDDGRSGFVVDGTSAAVAGAMARIAADANLRTTMGRTARAAFEDSFRVEHMIDKYDALYRRLGPVAHA